MVWEISCSWIFFTRKYFLKFLDLQSKKYFSSKEKELKKIKNTQRKMLCIYINFFIANEKTQEVFTGKKIRWYEAFQSRGNSKISLTLKADALIESHRILAAIQRSRRRFPFAIARSGGSIARSIRRKAD